MRIPSALLSSAQARLSAALDQALDESTGAIAALIDVATRLRVAELSREPFSTGTYAEITAHLGALPPAANVEEVRGLLRRLAIEVLDGPEQALAAAARRIIRRGAALSDACDRVKEAVQTVRLRAIDLIAPVAAGLIGAALSTWSADQAAAVRDAAARVADLSGGDERARQARLLATTRIARGRTAAEHRYSRAPGVDVLHAFATTGRPELLSLEGPRATFWQACGAFWAAREYLPEGNPEGVVEAVRGFCAALAAELVPDDLGIATLYRRAGTDLPWRVWAAEAQPRVKAGAEAIPVHSHVFIEAPSDLVHAIDGAAFGATAIRAGDDLRRIVVAGLAHGYSLRWLLRVRAALVCKAGIVMLVCLVRGAHGRVMVARGYGYR